MSMNYKVFLLFLILALQQVIAIGYCEEIALSINRGTPCAEDSLEKVLLERRSIRLYTEKTISFDDLSRLLYYSYGITAEEESPYSFRAAPSAGACYPIDLYVSVNGVENIADGIYLYDVTKNVLRTHKKGSFNNVIAKHSYQQDFIADARIVIACVAEWSRTLQRYGKRGYRYVYLDAGHIAQNIYLEATNRGLKPCAIGAFDDSEINGVFNVDGNELTVIYLMTVGV